MGYAEIERRLPFGPRASDPAIGRRFFQIDERNAEKETGVFT